jgi:hypothetical protein
MRKLFFVVYCSVSTCAAAQAQGLPTRITYQLPTESELQKAWSMNIDKDAAVAGTTPGRLVLLGDRVLFYPADPSGALSKKPVQLPRDSLFSVPGYASPLVAPTVPANANPGNASARLAQENAAKQTNLLVNLTVAVEQLKHNLSSLQDTNRAISDSLQKAEARIKALETRSGTKP